MIRLGGTAVEHLAGGGDYTDTAAAAALGVLADAVAKRDPRTKNLYVDVSGVVGPRLELACRPELGMTTAGETMIAQGRTDGPVCDVGPFSRVYWRRSTWRLNEPFDVRGDCAVCGRRMLR